MNPREHHHQVGGVEFDANNSSSECGVKTVRHIAKWYESTLVGGGEEEEEDKNVERASYSLRRERVETLPKILGRPRPVVVLVSDVEGFQGSSALSDLLASFASFHRDVPFILLLGIPPTREPLTVHSVRDCFQTATKSLQTLRAD